jgi:hypothetical protein
MYVAVYNPGDFYLSLAGVAGVVQKSHSIINTDGLHQGIQDYVKAALNASIRNKALIEIARGTEEECKKAVAAFKAPVVDVVVPKVAEVKGMEPATVPSPINKSEAVVEEAVAGSVLENAKAPVASVEEQGGLLAKATKRVKG